MIKINNKFALICAGVMLAMAVAGCGSSTVKDDNTVVTDRDESKDKKDSKNDKESKEDKDSNDKDSEGKSDDTVQDTEKPDAGEGSETENSTNESSVSNSGVVTEIDYAGIISKSLNVNELLQQKHDYNLAFLVNELPEGQVNSIGTPYAVFEREDAYFVVGTIKAYELVDSVDELIMNLEAGDTFISMLGNEYTVTFNDHANNGNWIEIDFVDDAQKEYYFRYSLSGEIPATYVVIMNFETQKPVVRTFENVSFEVPMYSPMISPSPLYDDFSDEVLIGYHNIIMYDDGLIHSNDLPEFY